MCILDLRAATSSTDWPLPPGYRGLRPFDRDKHRGLGIDRAARARLARESSAIYLTAPEFFQAARTYPVAFTRPVDAGEQGSGPLLSVMITSFQTGENRFVDATGQWDQGVYVPAYVRRFPFHAVPIQRQGTEPDFLLCVDESGLTEDATPLFDATGKASPEWAELEKLVRDMEVARRQTRQLLDAIDELGVLESFEAQGMEDNGRVLRLGNLLRVNESRLNDLPGSTVRALMTVGALGRVYAHLMSLDNFAFLLERETATESERI